MVMTFATCTTGCYLRLLGTMQVVLHNLYLLTRSWRTIKVKVFTEQSIQVRIADILSAYDDLIENNRRRIALLERAARELYREWFVRLRFPGHEHTKIVDGVPEGWEREEDIRCL